MGSHLEQRLTAGEQAGGEPHELQTSLLAQSAPVVRQLLHDLAVDLVAQDLLRKQAVIRHQPSSSAVIVRGHCQCRVSGQPGTSKMTMRNG